MKKLIEKSNQQFLVVLVILLSISSLIIFFLLNRYIKDELDEKLRNDEWRIIEKLKKNPHIISISPIIEVDTTNITVENEGEIKNVMVYDFIEKEKEPYRELVSIKKINDTFYKIQVRQSTIENKDMLFAIGITLFSVFALLVVILFYINNRLSMRLWKPFYINISALKKFSFQENKPLELVDSDVAEFQQFNQSVKELTDKLSKDYIALKEFTENASHEIQTPLSIILMNIEAVLQSELNEANYKKLYSSFQAAKRLSILNEKLLLLAKLDNNEKGDVQQIDIEERIKFQLSSLEPLIEDKSLKIILSTTEKMFLFIDPVIADILLINLFSNAIKHNIEKGYIRISINQNTVSITNSKNELYIQTNDLFKRFKKGNLTSSGLGLSIVEKIALAYGLSLSVQQNDDDITFTIKK